MQVDWSVFFMGITPGDSLPGKAFYSRLSYTERQLLWDVGSKSQMLPVVGEERNYIY